jgi:hypothetical protein
MEKVPDRTRQLDEVDGEVQVTAAQSGIIGDVATEGHEIVNAVAVVGAQDVL